jgi:hypothetical protein
VTTPAIMAGVAVAEDIPVDVRTYVGRRQEGA